MSNARKNLLQEYDEEVEAKEIVEAVNTIVEGNVEGCFSTYCTNYKTL